MLVNRAALKAVEKGINAAFSGAFNSKPDADYTKIATIVPSSHADEDYGWLGQFPSLEEWAGERVIKALKAGTYRLKNKKFTGTIKVERDHISDDKLGQYQLIAQEMGLTAAEFPDELVFAQALAGGFTGLCFDGQPFFDDEHPVMVDGKEAVASNVATGTDKPWFLLACDRVLKPLIFQDREKFELSSITDLDSDHVFKYEEYLFGVRGRCNAGYGLWQQAYASKAALDGTNFDAAWAAMAGRKSDEGRPMRIKPTHLVVGASNRAAAQALVSVQTLANGASNPNYKAVEVIVSPYLE